MNRRTFFGRLAGVAAALGIGSRVVKAEKKWGTAKANFAKREAIDLPGVWVREDGSRTLVAYNPITSHETGWVRHECVAIAEQFPDTRSKYGACFIGNISHGAHKGKPVVVRSIGQVPHPTGLPPVVHWIITRMGV